MALLKDLDDLETNGKKGDWAFLKDDTWIAIRYGESVFKGMVIIPIADKEKSNWSWNGNKEAPTLTPSILVESVPDWNEGWHGWLRNGILETA